MAKAIQFDPEDCPFAAKVIASLIVTVQPELNESESIKLIESFLMQNHMDCTKAHELGILLLTAFFVPDPTHLN